MVITRFCMALTISRLWVTTTTVVPLSLISSSNFMISQELLGSQITGGLICQQYGRIVHQRSGQECNTLLLTAGELFGLGLIFACQSHSCQNRRNISADLTDGVSTIRCANATFSPDIAVIQQSEIWNTTPRLRRKRGICLCFNFARSFPIT